MDKKHVKQIQKIADLPLSFEKGEAVIIGTMGIGAEETSIVYGGDSIGLMKIIMQAIFAHSSACGADPVAYAEGLLRSVKATAAMENSGDE